jgi:hypothetical protein
MIAYRWTANCILREEKSIDAVDPPQEGLRPRRTMMGEKQPTQNEDKKGRARTMTAGKAVILEYPTEGETVAGDSYTFRISAPEGTRLTELSINQGPWQVCRHAAGYWWFDWTGFRVGEYQVRARAHSQDGRVEMTLLRKFQVVQPA